MSSIHSSTRDSASQLTRDERATSSIASPQPDLAGGCGEPCRSEPSHNRDSVEKSLFRCGYPPAIVSGLHGAFDDRREALLFVHFIQKLAPVIDICDPAHSFGTEVPRRALQSPLLTFSILSFASRDWALVHGYDDGCSTKYYSLALQILIPMLDASVESLDENVLAAIVLLRLYEETTETAETDTGTHLLGSTRLLNSASSFAYRGGIGEAASWIVLRQHIYLSVTRHEPIRIHLDNYLRSSSFQDASPESLTNRIIHLCGRALVPANNPRGRWDYEGWAQLRTEVTRWYESVPWPLKPDANCLARETTDGLPYLWVPAPVHVIAYQHFYLSMLLLEVYEPRNWIPGIEALLARPRIEEAIRQNVLMIFSLAISNPTIMTASLTAHHVLYVYGAFIREEPHRQAILGFLRQIPTRVGWETAQVITKLQQEWSHPPFHS